MSHLRHPDIRPRDIRALVGRKRDQLVWDPGTLESSEWVLTSLENEKHLKRTRDWLVGKEISESTEALLVRSYFTKLKTITWGNVLEHPQFYFNNVEFWLYELDLKWLLEYKPQPISRFGRFNG